MPDNWRDLSLTTFALSECPTRSFTMGLLPTIYLHIPIFEFLDTLILAHFWNGSKGLLLKKVNVIIYSAIILPVFFLLSDSQDYDELNIFRQNLEHEIKCF